MKKKVAIIFTSVLMMLTMSISALAAGWQADAVGWWYDNGDGTYKLELSVTGDADNEDLSAAGANIALIYDVSQSMTNPAGSSSNSRADETEDIVHDFLDDLLVYKRNGSDIRVSLVTFARTASKIQGWTDDVQSVRDRFDDGTGERQ